MSDRKRRRVLSDREGGQKKGKGRVYKEMERENEGVKQSVLPVLAP